MKLQKPALSAVLAFAIWACPWGETARAGVDERVSGMQTITNVSYVPGSDSSYQSMDLYLPQGLARPAPAIVWIHGGSWLSGDKNPCPPAYFVGQGYAAVSINYRLSQEATFPAQIYDCKAAIRFLRAHAKQYHIDPNRIGVWGASAGGHLAALLGTTGVPKKLEGALGNNKVSSAVQACCDWCGPTDFNSILAEIQKHGTLNEASQWRPVCMLLGNKVDKQTQTFVSPVTYATKSDPPFLIMHGDQDTIVPDEQSRDLYNVLKKNNVDASLIVLKGFGHDLSTPEALRTVLAFFNRTLKKG